MPKPLGKLGQADHPVQEGPWAIITVHCFGPEQWLLEGIIINEIWAKVCTIKATPRAFVLRCYIGKERREHKLKITCIKKVKRRERGRGSGNEGGKRGERL